VDEVGQFIGQNSKLMLNLQTLAETLATRLSRSRMDLRYVSGRPGHCCR